MKTYLHNIDKICEKNNKIIQTRLTAIDDRKTCGYHLHILFYVVIFFYSFIFSSIEDSKSSYEMSTNKYIYSNSFGNFNTICKFI